VNKDEKLADEENLYGKAEDVLMGIQGADGSFAGEGNPQCFANQPGLSCDPESAVCLGAAIPGARRGSLRA